VTKKKQIRTYIIDFFLIYTIEWDGSEHTLLCSERMFQNLLRKKLMKIKNVHDFFFKKKKAKMEKSIIHASEQALSSTSQMH
jgi:hypothetical protein